MEIVKIARAGIVIVKSDELIDGWKYTAHKSSKGVVRITATNACGEVRYPMLTQANQAMWNTLRQVALNA